MRPTEAALHRQRLYGAVSQKKGGRGDRLCDEGRRGAHPRRGLPSLFVEADLGAQVHRDHPPLSRGRPEYASHSPQSPSGKAATPPKVNIAVARWAWIRRSYSSTTRSVRHSAKCCI